MSPCAAACATWPLALTSRAVLEKFAAIQMLDVHLPTTDDRTVILSRYTQPEPDVQVLLQELKLGLPPSRRPKSPPPAAWRQRVL